MLTGAAGFVGRSLMLSLHHLGHECVGTARTTLEIAPGVTTQLVGDMASGLRWQGLLEGVDCVIHLAARAHLLNDRSADPQSEFDRVNYHATMELVQQAAEVGVKRFIYVSSIGVHGAASGSTPFKESSALMPHSHYALSKLKAEEGIKEYLSGKGMEWVIVRPPLIYAADAPGNFNLLLDFVKKEFPLPFASISNLRSMIALDNVVSFLECCARHPNAAGEVFLISDGDDFSISDIVRLLAEGMGVGCRLFKFPSQIIKYGANVVGRGNMYTQLFESLQVDSSKARNVLGWRPPVSAHIAMVDTGRTYHSRIHKSR